MSSAEPRFCGERPRIYAFPCLWENKSVSEYVERNCKCSRKLTFLRKLLSFFCLTTNDSFFVLVGARSVLPRKGTL